MTDTSNPLEMALNQLTQERNDLDIAIAALQKRLGRAVNTPAMAASSAAPKMGPSSEIVTYHGEFHNLSLTKATEQLLKRVGRPLNTPQILKALQNASFEMKAKSPRTNLYTTLKRSPMFVKVLPDTWDLADRHPQAAALKQEERAKKHNPKQEKSERKPQSVAKAQERAA